MKRILGQDRAVAILQNALASGRVHHAWIFSGPKGVGKLTTAIEFARILLDPDAQPDLSGEIEADPDGRTSRLIDEGTHPDLHVIRKERALLSDNPDLRKKKLHNIPLDLLRELVIGGKTGDGRYREGPAYRTAKMGHGKVFIVDEAELIGREGQGSLLKTLEEPPPETYLILVTSGPQRLYPTVHSRCQHVRFGPLDHESMSAWFERAKLERGAEEQRWIEQFSAGSPGVAQLAAEYGMYRWHQALAPMLKQLDRGHYPAEMGDVLGELVEGYATAWVKANRNASKDAANKAGASHVLSLLAAHARANLEEACTKGGDAERSLAAVDLIRAAELQLASNVNMKQVLENLVVQWSNAGPVGVRG